jgi:hypothetical protein
VENSRGTFNFISAEIVIKPKTVDGFGQAVIFYTFRTFRLLGNQPFWFTDITVTFI